MNKLLYVGLILGFFQHFVIYKFGQKDWTELPDGFCIAVLLVDVCGQGSVPLAGEVAVEAVVLVGAERKTFFF